MKNKYFWNTIAGLLNASEAIFLCMFTNRITGLSDSGILTVAFSIGNLFSSVGRWGIRTVQVTDGGEFSFKDYSNARKISISVQILSSFIYILAYLAVAGCSLIKTYVMIVMSLIYASEIIEDTFWGHFQKFGHIETGAKIFILRWSVIIISYGIILYATHSIVLSITVAAILSFVVLYFALKRTWIPYKQMKEKYKHAEKDILRRCFQIMITSFLSFYIINAAKISVDANLGSKEVAIFGFISMPIFGVNLLSGFIYNPQIVDYSKDLFAKRWKTYRKRVAIQLLAIVVITIISLIGVDLIGIPILNFIYAVNLYPYKQALMILMLASGCYAVTTFLSTTLVIEKKPRYALIAFTVASIFSLFIYKPLIAFNGINGVALGVFFVMLVNAAVSLGFEIYSQYRLAHGKGRW